MPNRRMLSYLLVGVQFACLIFIALTGPLIARNPLFLSMEAAALALALWALLAVRIENIHVLPDVRPQSRLVRHGPYRWIRHPMYASLLLGTLALVLEAPSWWRWGIWSVLLIDLLVKLRHEERLLAAHFPEYQAYMAESRRLVPYLF
jgi:protein-S-isoprenylcysteine O-methyltransferase Ste14